MLYRIKQRIFDFQQKNEIEILKMSEKNRFRVIVIGGGLAGLSAANHLVTIY